MLLQAEREKNTLEKFNFALSRKLEALEELKKVLKVRAEEEADDLACVPVAQKHWKGFNEMIYQHFPKKSTVTLPVP
jgi:hypothetical protein